MITHRSKGFVYPDYVSPLPADEFLKGVQYKQKMFDEGVTLVNSQLDTYREIRNSLLKDQDKKYFDQEATKLVNALNKTAGLDFSVKGNVTAALNTGKQLINDQYIKSAAESSATYKKMMEEYSKLDASKKSNVNDFFFFNEIKNWQNDGKVGSKLNYNPYTVYTDEHVKLWGELSKTLKPEEVEYPEMVNGQWIMKKSFSGVTAERFKKAYLNGLSAQGKNQLDMEARYRVMNSDKDALVKSFYENYQTILSDINLKISQNETDKGEAAKKYGPNSPEVMRINQNINEFNLTRQYYNEQLSKPADQISDSDLAGFIKDSIITDASGSFAYENKKQELKENPYAVDRAKMMNNIAEHEAKIKINAQYGLDADGKKAEGNLFGIDPVSATDISSTVSGLNGSKTVQNLSSTLNIIADDADAPYLISGIRAFSGVSPDGTDTKTIKDVVRRAMVSGTWAEGDRQEILATMAGKDEIAKGVATKKVDNTQANTILQANKKKATTWLDYAKKIGTSIYDVYDLQTGSVSDDDDEDLTAANVTSQLLANNSGISIKNSNTQSKWASDLKTKIPNADKAETFNSDGTGLTFVPKKNNIYIFRRDSKGKLVKLSIETEAFLNMPASYLNGIEDVRLPQD